MSPEEKLICPNRGFLSACVKRGGCWWWSLTDELWLVSQRPNCFPAHYLGCSSGDPPPPLLWGRRRRTALTHYSAQPSISLPPPKMLRSTHQQLSVQTAGSLWRTFCHDYIFNSEINFTRLALVFQTELLFSLPVFWRDESRQQRFYWASSLSPKKGSSGLLEPVGRLLAVISSLTDLCVTSLARVKIPPHFPATPGQFTDQRQVDEFIHPFMISISLWGRLC